MISFITDMEKLLISVRSMTVKSSFKAVALSFLLAAAFLFYSVSAFADFQVDSSFLVDSFAVAPVADLGTAFITRAALGALGVEIGTSLLDSSPADVAHAIWYGGGSTLPPSFTFADHLVEYLSRETIRIRPDSITIDGVEYSDVWLPHDCANKFRTNAFDFITRYNISSESVGTFVSGVGTLNGTPVYEVDGVYRTSAYVFPLYSRGSVGDWTVTAGDGSLLMYHGSNRESPSPSGSDRGYPVSIYCIVGNYTGSRPTSKLRYTFYGGYAANTTSYYVDTSVLNRTPFDFDWAASYIPVEPLPYTDGLRLRVPASIISTLPQIIDPSSSTYESDLASLIESLDSSAADGSLVDPAFEAWDAPVPPATNTIANEPYSSLSGSLNGIQSIISSISSSVSGIAESIVGADSTFFGNIVSALATPFEPVFAVFRSGVGIWRYVVSWVGTISAPFTWSLSALGSAGSYFLSPIYAAAAAAVVLAVYKKFGR